MSAPLFFYLILSSILCLYPSLGEDNMFCFVYRRLVAENGTKLLLGLERDPASWDNLPPVLHNKRGTLFVQGTIEALNRMQSANKFADDKGPLFSGIFFDETFTACTKWCNKNYGLYGWIHELWRLLQHTFPIFAIFTDCYRQCPTVSRFPSALRRFLFEPSSISLLECTSLDPLFVSEGVDPMNSIVYQTGMSAD